jgi:hypothetical protein
MYRFEGLGQMSYRMPAGASVLPSAVAARANARRARLQRALSTYRKRHGMGSMSYYDLLAQVPRRDCDPWDSECVAQNAAMVTAVQDYWDTHMFLPGGVPEGTQLDFSTLSAKQVQQFMQNQPITSGVMTVDEQPYVSQAVPGPAPGEASRSYVSAAPAAPVAAAPQAAAPTTPAGQVVTVLNGGATAPGAATPAPAVTGFTDWLQGSMFGGFPNWGLVAAGIGAVFLLGGGRGR